MPRFLKSPCTHPEKGKEQLLGPVTQVEDDVDRIQTLLKETFFLTILEIIYFLIHVYIYIL